MTTTNFKQIACYLKPTQITALKKLSVATGAPVQHYLRLAVDQFLAKKKPAKR
jgi:hypothetical protein